jgi:hypothetical protein
MRRNGFILLSLCGVIFLIGCEPKLETGYAPRELNASEETRNAYYAPAYSPEALGQKKNDGSGFNFGQ